MFTLLALMFSLLALLASFLCVSLWCSFRGRSSSSCLSIFLHLFTSSSPDNWRWWWKSFSQTCVCVCLLLSACQCVSCVQIQWPVRPPRWYSDINKVVYVTSSMQSRKQLMTIRRLLLSLVECNTDTWRVRTPNQPFTGVNQWETNLSPWWLAAV